MIFPAEVQKVIFSHDFSCRSTKSDILPLTLSQDTHIDSQQVRKIWRTRGTLYLTHGAAKTWGRLTPPLPSSSRVNAGHRIQMQYAFSMHTNAFRTMQFTNIPYNRKGNKILSSHRNARWIIYVMRSLRYIYRQVRRKLTQPSHQGSFAVFVLAQSFFSWQLLP